MESLKAIPITQVVTFLTALSPFVAAGAGWFNDLAWQVQLGWVVVVGAVICTWVAYRAKYVIQLKQNEVNLAAKR